MSEGDALDPERIAGRVLRPDRPRLAEALACVFAMPEELAASAARSELQWLEREGWLRWTDRVTTRSERFRLDRGHFDPQSAWEAVEAHGLVSSDWQQDGRRSFITRSLDRAIIDRSMEPRSTSYPHTLRACALAAADAEALCAVETLCAQARRALVPWGLDEIEPRWLWQFEAEPWFARKGAVGDDVSRDIVLPSPSIDPWKCPLDVRRMIPCSRASKALGSIEPSKKRAFNDLETGAWRDRFARVAFAIAEDANRWERAARLGRRIPSLEDDRTFPEALKGVPFSSLANPFQPLAAIYGLGYAVRSLAPVMHLLAFEG
jgi:hypothetical protein